MKRPTVTDDLRHDLSVWRARLGIGSRNEMVRLIIDEYRAKKSK